MDRSKYISKTTTKAIDKKLDRYVEACRVFREFNELKLQLEHFGAIFGEVEDKINDILRGLPKYELVHEWTTEHELVEAFIHNGPKMQVKFKLRNLNTTLVYNVTLKTQDVFELTAEEIVSRIQRFVDNPMYLG
jgi:hypothetical protein